MFNLSLVTTIFFGLNLDFFIILLFLIQKYKFKDTFLGYELGMSVIFIISAVAGQTIQNFIPEWAIGILGLIPIYVGIKGESEETERKSNSHKDAITVMLIYAAGCGADNLAVYIPLLSKMTVPAIMLTLLYFMVLVGVMMLLALLVQRIPIIKKFLEQYSEKISRIVYILIGIFVMYDTGLIQKLISLF
ncbi:cadmium resistance transporter [Weissella viridescens]|uniref:cadmium resistance transporter n=1 Tax=Weissella viridescens TaxID=1629 RepID=UPI001D08B9AD|nr:cadmium resistance transporter [Weissella viridescens]MCB6840604.1 cadmium resistance transporter [Weissella viridescens]MCB6847288.1 cadmium resistance transporter [Weissella viridescens]